jgi:hypothetical protein
MHDGNKSRLNLGHSCYHLVSILASHLLSKNVTIEIDTQFCLLFYIGMKLGLSY